ncbi:putative Insulin-like growth factor-binding protein complex acid labile subunit [Hypsibius exemplaris]|uniref:Insulin-like growth factor-binding protein complex acid labile subunit n=1 Tax=Hypsibius exemplaris TaxID=2072580 RepID=A0A1W0WPZ4_HYPEX|nr:putative Insulin-like growth factor-binding protein complex acid labile subunit [Hypsibius exemplaris]
MDYHLHFPVWILSFTHLFTFIQASCPFACTCDLDELGRRRTRCEDGGLSIPAAIDIATIDYDVQILILSGTAERPNNITRLTPDMLRNKPYLQELRITHSNLPDIGFATFELLSESLRILNLTYNRIEILHEDNFRNLSRLTHLHLDHNQIESFHSAMFAYLSEMSVLTVSDNRLRITRCTSQAECGNLQPRMGTALPSLAYLDLSRNSIGPIVPDLFFQDLSGLRVLNLSKNGLETLPWQTLQANNANLEDIDLSGNLIKRIEAGQLPQLKHVRRLDFSGNPLNYIGSEAFRGLVLDYLNLANTSQSVLGPNVFLHCRVINLNISDMGLKILSSTTFRPIAQDVLTLDVSGNPELVLQPKMFDFLPSLRVLVMRRMYLIGLPMDFFGYANDIESVDLSENKILALDERVFAPLQNLLRLNLYRNQLRTVPSSVVLPRIEDIDLSDNRLTSFPNAIVDALSTPGTSLKSLHLNTNPWTCDCGLAKIIQWLNVTQSGPLGYEAVCVGRNAFTCPVCYQPANSRGVPLPAVKVPSCDLSASLNLAPQQTFLQRTSPGTDASKEPWTLLTGVFINNTIINNAVISNVLLKNATFSP